MNETDQPVLIDGHASGAGQPAITPSGELQSVRDAYDALDDKSGRRRK